MNITAKIKALWDWIKSKLAWESEEVSLAVENLILLLSNDPEQFTLTSYVQESKSVFIEPKNRDFKTANGDMKNCAIARLEPTGITLVTESDYRVELTHYELKVLLPVIRWFVNSVN